jgi:tetratricopeptide (TPR) repeat protein
LDALEIAPDDGQSHYNLGLVLLSQGDLPAARLHLQRAERLGQRATPEIRRDAGIE